MSFLKKVILFIFFFSLALSSFGKEIKDSDFILNIDEIQRGMILTSRTRIGGNQMLDFKLKVLSILKNNQAKSSSILAEIIHPYFQKNGVLAGMSGSPVYYEKKLLGAIAFTSSFLKKPIVGITHIKDMLKIFSWSERKSDLLNSVINFDPPSTSLIPINTPLSIHSKLKINPKELNESLQLKNTVISPQGDRLTTNKIGFKNSKIIPGDLIGVNLVRGDINISAYGTVTYKKKNKILAFGHPISHLGKSSLSFYKAYTDAVVPLQTVSYKVGSLLKEIGTIKEDRASGIGGIIGEKAQYVPINFTIVSPQNNEKIIFEVIDDENYFIPLTLSLLKSTFVQLEALRSKLLLETTLKVKTDFNNQTISFKNQSTYIENQQGLDSILINLNNVLLSLFNNTFQPIKIKGINLKLNIKNDIKYYLISEVESFKKIFYPGEIMKIKVKFDRFQKPAIIKNFNFQIPLSLMEGEYQVNVSSEVVRFWNEFSVNSEKWSIYNIQELIEFYNQQPQDNKLNIWFFEQEKIFKSGTKTYKNLPFSKTQLIQKNFLQKKSRIISSYFQEEELAIPIMGSANFLIKVKENEFK